MLAPKAVWIAAALAVLPLADAAGQGVGWHDDLHQAMDAAQQSKRLVLVHFWNETCAPCLALEKHVFNQPTVALAVSQMYVPVKVNTNDSPGVAQAYGVTQVPTDVVLTADGRVVRRLTSPNTPMAYIAALRDVATAVTSQSGSTFQRVAAQAPYGPPANSAYANLQLPPATPAQGPIAAPPTMQAAAGDSPLAGLPQQRAEQASHDRYASAPAVQSNPYATGAEASTNQEPAAQAATGQQAQSPMAADTGAPPADPREEFPGLPPNVPPLGFDGYCTVTMKRELRWQKGDVKWGAVHRGRTYLFAGEQQRDEFLKTPDVYSPVLSGMDPVVALEENRTAPGRRTLALEYLGQFYMFSSEESMNKFWTNPEGYAQGVRQAMAVGEGRTVR